MHIKLATLDEKRIVANLMQLYLHDLSELDGNAPDAFGIFSPIRYFDLYWSESGRYPYLIYTCQMPVGFALVREIGPGVRSMAEFFIMRHVRKAGIGSMAANHIFNMHPGGWQVAQQKENHSAHSFWKAAINRYTGGNFTESWSESSPIGPMQLFTTPVQPGTAADAFGAADL